MEGLTIQSLKRRKSLIPLYVCMAVGYTGAVMYMFRTALFSPDISWNWRRNPHPWEAYRAKQYKLYSPSDVTPESPAPQY